MAKKKIEPRSPQAFEMDWNAMLDCDYGTMEAPFRSQVDKLVRAELEKNKDDVPAELDWPCSLMTDVDTWPDEAVGKTGKEFVRKQAKTNNLTVPVLMTSRKKKGGSKILEWEEDKFWRALEIVRKAVLLVQQDDNKRISELVEDIQHDMDVMYEYEVDRAGQQMNQLLYELSNAGVMEKVKDAWAFCFPDEDPFPATGFYSGTPDGIKDLMEDIGDNDKLSQQFYCLMQDCITELEHEDLHLIARDGDALTLWWWDDGILLAFLTACRIVLLEKKND